MKTLSVAAQYRRIRIRLIIFGLMLSLSATQMVRGAGADISLLRKQLAAAEEAEDKPAIVELNRRIVAATPADSAAWQEIVETQFALEDYGRVAETLDAWQKATKNPPADIENFRGDLAVKLKDYPAAERHYRAFLAKKPSRADTAAVYDQLADLFVQQQRITDAESIDVKAIAAEDTPTRRVYHATALLRLHRWDAAYAEMEKANKADSTDEQVKEWLPQFEKLAEFLPRIKALDAQIAKRPNDVDLLLDRARLFTLANRPILALDDCQKAMKLDPSSVRARIQTGEALLDDNRDEEAAKLQVGRNLARDAEKHVSEEALRRLKQKDAEIAHDPNAAQPLADRAETLRDLNQFVLSLADAEAALAIDDDNAAAHFETANNLKAIDRAKDALPHAARATELIPNNWMAWYSRGVLEAARADFPAAIESQTKSLEIKETLNSLHEREKCERRIGQNEKADADLKRIRELDPTASE